MKFSWQPRNCHSLQNSENMYFLAIKNKKLKLLCFIYFKSIFALKKLKKIFF